MKDARMDAREVEGSGLLSRPAGNSREGSNPSPSAARLGSERAPCGERGAVRFSSERGGTRGQDAADPAAYQLREVVNVPHTHFGRSWVGHELEDGCPCGHAPCGLVDSTKIDPACPQHALDAAKTIRQSHAAAECPTPHEPDHMGVWADDCELVWLPRSIYPKRIDAIRWAMDEWSCDFLEVRALARWMRWQPFSAHNLDGSVAWSEDQWYECEKDALGAFRVWRLEAA